jgi:hypothetical protein
MKRNQQKKTKTEKSADKKQSLQTQLHLKAIIITKNKNRKFEEINNSTKVKNDLDLVYKLDQIVISNNNTDQIKPISTRSKTFSESLTNSKKIKRMCNRCFITVQQQIGPLTQIHPFLNSIIHSFLNTTIRILSKPKKLSNSSNLSSLSSISLQSANNRPFQTHSHHILQNENSFIESPVLDSSKLKQVPVKEANGLVLSLFSSISTNRTRDPVDSTSKNNLDEKKKHTISETDEPNSQNKVMACHIDDQNS